MSSRPSRGSAGPSRRSARRHSPTAQEAAARHWGPIDAVFGHKQTRSSRVPEEIWLLVEKNSVWPPKLRMPKPGRSSREKINRQTIKVLHDKNDSLIAENERLRRAWDNALHADEQEARHLAELSALEKQNKQERDGFAVQKEELHRKYGTEREHAVLEMKLATIEEYEKIEEGMTKELERLQAELKAMKESYNTSSNSAVMTIHHIGITVPKERFDETVKFYEAALKPLGYRVMMQPVEGVVGLGNTMVPDMWISIENKKMRAGGDIHLCFYGKRKGQVHAFHEAALKAGAQDNGGPGHRPQYVWFYYAAFVIDPVGNNLEVMTCDFEKYWNIAYAAGTAVVAALGGWLWQSGKLG